MCVFMFDKEIGRNQQIMTLFFRYVCVGDFGDFFFIVCHNFTSDLRSSSHDIG